MPELRFSTLEIDHIMGGVALEEGMRLANYAAQVPANRAIVEVGSHGGSSACWLAMGAKKGNGAPVFAVDLWDLPAGERREAYANEAVKRRFDAQIEYCVAAGLMEPVRALQGDSTVIASQWAEQTWEVLPIGLLHIDGMHTVEGCSADIRAWTPFVAAGGFVIFHDYSRPGPRAAVRSLMTPPQWECISTHRWQETKLRGQWIGRRAA